MRRTLVAVLLVFVGCSNALNRDVAAEIIKSSTQFQESPELWVNVGRVGPSCESLSPSDNVEVTVAKLAGYVTVKQDGRNFWQIRLTDKGRALPEAKKMESDPPDTKDGCSTQLLTLPLATRELGEVTGVTGSDREAQVEFRYKWKPTELGSALIDNGSVYTKLSSDQQDSLKTIIQKRSANLWKGAPLELPITDVAVSVGVNGSARFQKYDDGWRLMTP
jgi:hypothetical protein